MVSLQYSACLGSSATLLSGKSKQTVKLLLVLEIHFLLLLVVLPDPLLSI